MTSIIHPPLYKRDTTGGIRQWQLEQDGDRYRTLSGIVGGKLAESGWTVAVGKNIGKKNETTGVTQADAEVAAEYKKKGDRGYFVSPDDVDKVVFTKPMLAQDWAKVKNKPQTGYAQPKLDGIRCIARSDGLWTRTGQKITAVPHIVEALAPFFARFPDAILDGELYNHDLKDNFNQIASMVRKVAPEPEELEAAAEYIQYHIYDQVDTDLGFDDRVVGQLGSMLYQVYPKGSRPTCLQCVGTFPFRDHEHLDQFYAIWLTEGYEGQMIRLDAPYEPGKRSKTLLKRKEFLSAEFKVVEVEAGIGNWAGFAKKFRLLLDDGREFGAGVRGDRATLQTLLEGATPDWATVRYFTPTPDGIPRFPVVTDWGWGERRD